MKPEIVYVVTFFSYRTRKYGKICITHIWTLSNTEQKYSLDDNYYLICHSSILCKYLNTSSCNLMRDSLNLHLKVKTRWNQISNKIYTFKEALLGKVGWVFLKKLFL